MTGRDSFIALRLKAGAGERGAGFEIHNSLEKSAAATIKTRAALAGWSVEVRAEILHTLSMIPLLAP